MDSFGLNEIETVHCKLDEAFGAGGGGQGGYLPLLPQLLQQNLTGTLFSKGIELLIAPLDPGFSGLPTGPLDEAAVSRVSFCKFRHDR